MKKVRFFWGFCMLAALLICGAVHACAEREVTYNADDMTVTYSETEMTVRNNGTAYFAVYDKNRLIAISTKEVGRSDSSVSLTVDVNAEPCLGKVFMFDSDLKPMAEVVVLDNKTENTYALIDETMLTDYNKSAAVKVLAGPSSLIESYGSLEYYVITVIDEAERYEDCVQVRRS